MTKIYRSVYKDIASVVIENDTLKAAFLSQLGAKLCSLVNKKTDKEFLFQKKGNTYRLQGYGGDYIQGECSGFDDAFPTIDEYRYDRYPWKGVEIPDHGEVWSLKWDCRIDDQSIDFSVKGIRLPYTLKKRITLTDNCTLKIEYELENNCDYEIDFIWAAHMMFIAEKGCRIVTPKDMTEAVCVMSDSGLIGKYGDEIKYPITERAGSVYDFSVHRGKETDDYQKIYFKKRMSEGWGELVYPDRSKVRIEFPVDKVPYFGAIQGEGGKIGINSIFFEPCTGTFDRPDIAKKRKQNSIIYPKSKIKWHLKILII